MKEKLDELLNLLLGLSGKALSDVNWTDNVFSFSYSGGKFILIRSISANLLTGYITLYHQTPFQGSQHLIKVEDFEVKINRDGYGFDYRIKNYLDFSGISRNLDDDGYMRINQEDLLQIFPMQLSAKLIKDNFIIYLS